MFIDAVSQKRMIHLGNVALSIITATVGLQILIWLLVIGFEYMQW